MTSIERTAYPRFKRLITARELHLFFSPSREEAEWAAARTQFVEHRPALLLMLKSYQRMGCFPKLEEIPDMVTPRSGRPSSTAPWFVPGRLDGHPTLGFPERLGLTAVIEPPGSHEACPHPARPGWVRPAEGLT